ncbi:TlpA disulfide reductase family protein [Curtobacterium sp. MCLR17_032]|uniref:TlpA family protein disulfide reductase n=1 Tax=Curtobacterium sp. MCLR17_032 TaxID=2175650 RepID=UPI000DA7061A|nr:TlpA disulfide reductase family protein [Curtobacterium sp. MCLR17_032]WIE61419.1 TlpA disulfide reductase family protein [Curtobacterium sp. MCLR17_032]
MKLRSLLVVAVTLALGLGAASCSSDNDSLANQYKSGDTKNYISGDGAVSEFGAKDRGAPVDFTTKDLQGAEVTAEGLRGKVAVLNFWYASCAPCRAEAKDLESVSQKTTSDATFVGVNVRDSSGTAEAFVRSFNVQYTNVLDADSGAVQIAFAGKNAPNSTPATIVLDKQGRVSSRILGQINANVLETLVNDAAKSS